MSMTQATEHYHTSDRAISSVSQCEEQHVLFTMRLPFSLIARDSVP